MQEGRGCRPYPTRYSDAQLSGAYVDARSALGAGRDLREPASGGEALKNRSRFQRRCGEAGLVTGLPPTDRPVAMRTSVCASSSSSGTYRALRARSNEPPTSGRLRLPTSPPSLACCKNRRRRAFPSTGARAAVVDGELVAPTVPPGTWLTKLVNLLSFYTVDHSARESMKSAASCVN